MWSNCFIIKWEGALAQIIFYEYIFNIHCVFGHKRETKNKLMSKFKEKWSDNKMNISHLYLYEIFTHANLFFSWLLQTLMRTSFLSVFYINLPRTLKNVQNSIGTDKFSRISFIVWFLEILLTNDIFHNQENVLSHNKTALLFLL